jgi:hypothetical protein
MVTATQKNLLIFLCVIIFLTVVAVLSANLGFPNESGTTQSFAKWGLAAVLAEIVGLFVFVAKGIFQPKIGAYSLVISMPQDLEGLDISQIIWDIKNCFLALLLPNSEEKLLIQPVLSDKGKSWEIKLPGALYDKVSETTPITLLLNDIKGNKWEKSFYLFQRPLDLQPLDKQKIKADYGYKDD